MKFGQNKPENRLKLAHTNLNEITERKSRV